MSLNGLRPLGRIDTTEVYFCNLVGYAQSPVDLSSIDSTLVLVDASYQINSEIESSLRAVMLKGADHIILTGIEARQYEDSLDQMIVQSGIERIQHATISTYCLPDFEEALNLAVCVEEQAILLLAVDLERVLSGLIDFGMQE